MSTVKVNMDICYSDTLADFQGCYFNYQMNLYLSRGLSNEEYLKIFTLQDPAEINNALQASPEYLNKILDLKAWNHYIEDEFIEVGIEYSREKNVFFRQICIDNYQIWGCSFEK